MEEGKTITSVGFKLKGDKLVSDFEGICFTWYIIIPIFLIIWHMHSHFADDNGVLVWDLEGTQNIILKYRYMDIHIKDNKVFYQNDEINYKEFDFPKHGRLRINIDDEIYYQEVKDFLRKNYKKISLYESGIVKMNFEEENINKEDISYLTLLEKYIENLSEENKEKCRELFSENIYC